MAFQIHTVTRMSISDVCDRAYVNTQALLPSDRIVVHTEFLTQKPHKAPVFLDNPSLELGAFGYAIPALLHSY